MLQPPKLKLPLLLVATPPVAGKNTAETASSEVLLTTHAMTIENAHTERGRRWPGMQW